ncbi:dienelactone hydrolase family-domain-containing protein [Endogone sp. FLAS-F59071]|nr:dienelactone hydrolase family-domain-containing protein [Endogone sp. FLAS-F59071]|eukprot:RUS16238.1 dienelactone hydrolase family-domain-containing protein [Endogone sp. FLAS-F59071]
MVRPTYSIKVYACEYSYEGGNRAAGRQRELHEKYPSVKKVGAQGYCWDAKYAVILGSRPDEITAIATARPSSQITVEEIKAIKVPSLWCCAEKDRSFINNMRIQYEELLANKVDLESTFKIYEGTKHGFVSRGDENNEKVQKASAEALNDMKAFFTERSVI